MSTPRRARRDIAPVSWELPAAAALGWLLLAVIILPAGQGAAGWLHTGHFTWPHGTTALGHSLGGLLTGHLGEGLPQGAVAELASPTATYALIAVAELLLVAATAGAVVLWWRRLGPGAMQGMATRAEVEAVLGLGNLRRRRAIIRPDRYRPGRHMRTDLHNLPEAYTATTAGGDTR